MELLASWPSIWAWILTHQFWFLGVLAMVLLASCAIVANPFSGRFGGRRGGI